MKATIRTLLACAAALAALAGATTAEAGGPGSIVYTKGGRLWVTSPDGKVKRQISKTGGFMSPSQDDHGNVVAQNDVYLYRMSQSGKLLNKPITTAFRTNGVIESVNGPFWPQVSPDGKLIAYTYALTAEHFDHSCNCVVTSPSFNVTYTPSNRFVESPLPVFGNARMYSKPSWIDNRSVLMTTVELHNFAGDVLDSIAIDSVGGGADSYRRWFTECTVCDSTLTLQMYRLNDGEMTRQRDKLAFVSGRLNGPADGSQLLLHPVSAPPPAVPPGNPCSVRGASGKFSSPTWSPDGQSLAWADGRGIWVGRVGNLTGVECQLTRRLVVPGGKEPDWGPAPVR